MLSAEIMARMGRDPSEIYTDLEQEEGSSFFKRIDANATSSQKALLKKISKEEIHATFLGGQDIEGILTSAPGNNAPIGGVKIISKDGWFAARPSGTENI